MKGKPKYASLVHSTLAFFHWMEAGRFVRLSLILSLLCLLPACGSSLSTPEEAAERSWQNGDCVAAAKAYETLLQKAGNGPPAIKYQFALGNVYYLCPDKKRRDLNRAQDHYRVVAEQSSDPTQAVTAWQRVAQIYSDNNHQYEAIAEYENLLQRYPDTAERRSIRLAIANLYNDLNNYSQAETEYEKVTSGPYDQLSGAAYLRIGSINNLRERYDRATPALQKIIAEDGDQHMRNQARFMLADILVHEFHYDEALAQLKLIEQPSATEADFIKKRREQFERDRQQHKASPNEFDWAK